MAQIFPKWTNRIPLIVGLGAIALLVGVTAIVWYYFTPKYTDVGYSPRQPVPYSHQLHAGQLGLDCRYCHQTVEKAAFAAVPPVSTCMGCHLHVKKTSPLLQPIRDAYADPKKPVEWVKVHMLPHFVHFNHSAHVSAGVGCASCHGRIDHMKVVQQAQPLSMSWCLECHRNPTPNLRPFNEVTNMAYDPAAAGYDPHKDPARKRTVNPPQNCSGCHY